jgi:endonuclease/exonuclease/phosphatase family metal-dependent hydrolase
MLVLTWNLFHGRSEPSAGRALTAEFAAALASWEWDVALLQEVPPWWPPALAAASGASWAAALTSRNELLALRRAIAVRAPDLIKSNGGGANAILVRGGAGGAVAAGPGPPPDCGQGIEEHREAVLRWWPERRVMHAVRLADGTWVANLHAQVHSEVHAQADVARASAMALSWAGDAPVILGGDMNTRAPVAPGFSLAGGHKVDHVLVRGLHAEGRARTLPHAPLSDHAPVLVEVRKDSGPGAS